MKRNRNNLFLLRTRRDLTQSQVAEQIGVHFSVISRYELGDLKPSQLTLDKLVKFFDQPATYLLRPMDRRMRP